MKSSNNRRVPVIEEFQKTGLGEKWFGVEIDAWKNCHHIKHGSGINAAVRLVKDPGTKEDFEGFLTAALLSFFLIVTGLPFLTQSKNWINTEIIF